MQREEMRSRDAQSRQFVQDKVNDFKIQQAAVAQTLENKLNAHTSDASVERTGRRGPLTPAQTARYARVRTVINSMEAMNEATDE